MVFSLCPDLPIISPRLSHFFLAKLRVQLRNFPMELPDCSLREAMAHLARLRNHQRVTISKMGQQF